MDINEIFPKLRKQERAVAYYFAIENGESNGLYKHTFTRLFGIDSTDYNRAIRTLDNYKLLNSRGWYNPTYAIKPLSRIEVIKYMMANDMGMYDTMSAVFKNSPKATGLLSILRYAILGDKTFFKGFLDHEIVACLLPYCEEEWIERLMPYFAPADVLWYVDNALYNQSILGHALSREAIDRLCNTKGMQPTAVETLEGLKIMYLFLTYGDYNIDVVPTTRSPWVITTAAIHHALQGDYEGAIKLFNAAFKIFNRTSSHKNVFLDLFPQYYLVMSYIHLDNSTSSTKLAMFVNKKDISDYISLLPARYLARVYLNSNRVPTDTTLRQMASAFFGLGEAINVRLMARLFDRYFEINEFPEKIPVPEYAILRHELSDYIDISDDERMHLREVYGTKPILTCIYRKKSWEIVLDDVIKTANLSSDVVMPLQTALPEARIVYVRTSDDLFDPKGQTRMKSGGWSKPKNVAKSKFMAQEIDYMDDTDRIIAKIMAPTAYSYSVQNYAQYFLPYLADSDRVFALTPNNEYTPIDVSTEQPYISVEKVNGKRGASFSLKSNVTLESLKKVVNSCVTVKVNEFKYAIIPVNENQRKVLEKLLSAPTFPLEAKAQLQKFLTRIDDVVDVHSSLLDADAAENADGSTKIAIKVEPNQGMVYTVGLYAKPLINGTSYCVPGVGKPVVYVTENGTNFRVKRDLKQEESNFKELVDLLDTPEHPMGGDEIVTVVEPEMLLEMLEYVRQNPDKAIVEWPQGKAVVLRTPLSQGSWNVGIKQNNGWFDVEGEVRIDDNTVVKMSRLLELIAEEKGRFIRLNDTDFVEIDKTLRRQLERIESLAVKNRNKVQISNFNAALLDTTALESAIKIQVDDSLQQLQKRIAESENVTPRVPKNLNATLRPYQVEGFQWMMRLASWGAGACLADDMGLGKTVQTIAFLLAKAADGPALIVAPASVVPNWRNELERFAPTLNVEILNRAENRQKAIKDAKKQDVVITTYGLLNTEEDDLSKKKWATICLDEAHTIKNRDTKMSKVAMSLHGKYHIILTGTPIQNHLGELWNLFNFINPGLLGSFESFRQKYAAPITVNNDKDRRRALQRIIKPFMLRRTKTEVIDDLPEKTDIVLPIELSDSEMALYEAMRKKAVEALEEAKTLDVNTLAEITKLRRAACSVSLIDNDWIGQSAKVQAFLDLVRDFKGDSNRMLVFSQFTSFLEIVRKALDEAGEKYLYLDGSTPMKQRERLVEEFQNGDCPLFLISLKAGGLGLNLTGANYVVHLDPWWNPAIEQQATDRSYRIGQNRNVTVYHLVAKNTIEEKIRRLHQTKRDLADSLLDGTDMAGKLTVADVLKLVCE